MIKLFEIFDSIRNTTARMLQNSGVSAEVTSEYLGHASAQSLGLG